MPLHISNAPEKNFSVAQPIIQSFVKEEKEAHHLMPHKIFDLSVVMLAEGAGLEYAKQTGWRYLFQEENGPYMVAEVGVNEAFDEHKFHHINQGGNVDSFIAILAELHQHQHVEERGYEINIVRISPLFTTAIWLSGNDHDHQFFIPLAPANSMFEAGRTYEYEEFMGRLQEVAQETLSR